MNCYQRVQKWRQARLACGNSPAGSSESRHIHCCSQSGVLTDARRCFRAYFHAKAQRRVLVNLPAEDCSGKDTGKIGLPKKSMHGTRDAARNWERDWQGYLENCGYELERSSRNLFHNNQKKENFKFDTRRRLCGERNEGEFGGAQEATGERVSNQSEH